MKKIMALLLAVLMMMVMLTGCGNDPVAEDLEKFINTDMVEVNAKYEDLKAEMNKWDSIKDDQGLISSIKDNVLPNIEESLELLSQIEPKTEEVKAIKEKYKKVLDSYKEGYQGILSALETNEEAAVEEAGKKIDEGVKYLD